MSVIGPDVGTLNMNLLCKKVLWLYYVHRLAHRVHSKDEHAGFSLNSILWQTAVSLISWPFYFIFFVFLFYGITLNAHLLQ